MPIFQHGHIIFGINQEGQKFRPSDWVSRIASIYGFFDASHHIHYNPNILPVHLEQQIGLFVSDKLADDNPLAYQHIMGFVSSNRLQVRYVCEPESPEPSVGMPRAA